MKTKWFKGLSEQQKKELKANYLQSDLVREKMILLLEEDINHSLKTMRAASSNEDPTNLYTAELSKQQALLEVISLLREKI